MINETKTNPFRGIVASVTLILPLALAMGVCSGFGAGSALACAAAAALCSFGGGFAPTYLVYLLALYMSASCGVPAACASGILACAIYYAASFCKADRLKGFIKPPVVAGMMLSTAFSLTALQTTNYFGIGASGNTVIHMLVSYRSLGFHANWRGVLYGTIVMVIMITFPRGLKKLSKTVSPAFIALVATTLLNLWLNPVMGMTAIDELGSYRGSFLDHFGPAPLSVSHIPYIILYGAAMAAVMVYKSLEVNSSFDGSLTGSIGCAASSALGGLPFTASRDAQRIGPLAGIAAAAVIVALYLSGIFERIPIHSLAVVIIVGAWQKVEWGKIAKAFKAGSKSAWVMLLTALLTVFAGPAISVIMVSLLCALVTLGKKKSAVADNN